MSQPINQEEQFTSNHFDLNLWKKLFKLVIKPHRKVLFKSFLIMIGIALVDIVIPLMIQYAIDEFVSNQQLKQLPIFMIAFIVLCLLQTYFIYKFIHNNGIVEGDMLVDVRTQMFSKIQNQSFSYFDNNASGWIITRLTSDIQRLVDMFAWSLVDAIWGVGVAVGILVVLLVVEIRLLLLMICLVPVILFISYFFQKRMLKNWREVKRVNSIITGKFSEGILGAKTTKVMGIEKIHIQDFVEETDSMYHKSIHAERLSSFYGPLIQVITSICSAFVLIYTGHQVIGGVLTVGGLMLFINYTKLFFEPIRNLSRLFSEFQMAQASAERVLSLLEKEIDVIDTPEVIEKYGTILEPKTENYPEMNGKIRFENVSFQYVENEPVLKDFNLTIQPGQTVALVGETGSGKTTISNLIARFYEPTEGTIYIDDKDYKEYSIGWLHHQLGVVLQTPHLFSGTVAENIRFGKPDASMEEIVSVAKKVNAHSFIMLLENGYDTEVGESGNRLSVGQKQLICFARALINNPKLVILDEASANIDSATELEITHAVTTLLHDRTAIVVAHRLSTIINSDVILVISKGEVIEKGTHQELLDLKGHYYLLYTNQFKNQSMV